jgi:hypothetical protein
VGEEGIGGIFIAFDTDAKQVLGIKMKPSICSRRK